MPGFVIGSYVLCPTTIFMAVIVPSYLLEHVDGAWPIANAWLADAPSDASKMETNTRASILLPVLFFVLNASSNFIYTVFKLSKDVVRFFYSLHTFYTHFF